MELARYAAFDERLALTAEELTEFDDYHGLTARPEDFDETTTEAYDPSNDVPQDVYGPPEDFE